QAVDDVELHLARDHELVLEQQVVVAVDRPADGVLERHDAVRRALPHHGFEHLVEALAGHRFDLRPTVEERRSFAVGARLSLIRESHDFSPATGCRTGCPRRAADAAAARTAPPASIAADETAISTASAHAGVGGM